MISIIILSYNTKEYTRKCLDSINRFTDIPYELIVIDNGSTDGAVDLLNERKANQEIDHLVLNQDNVGVAEGRNQGITLASQEIILFLDNDTEVSEEWYKPILEEFNNDPKVGVVGQVGFQVVQLSPIDFRSFNERVLTADCDVVPGYCFAFRKELLGKIGKQFSDFTNGKFWHEDLEYCLRAQKAGYKIRMNRCINLYHHGHKSEGENVTDADMVKKVDGFFENAREIGRRLISDNILYVHKEYKTEKLGAYDYILQRLSNELRKLGMVVLWVDPIRSKDISFGHCKMVDFNYKGYRICPVFIENDRPPRSWQQEIKHIDYLLAGSPWAKLACKNEPYNDKVIDLSPGGVNSLIFNTKATPAQSYKGIEFGNKFMFYLQAASQPRKNTENMIKWYCEAHRGNKNVILVFKDGPYGYSQDIAKLIEELSLDDSNPEILHIREEISDETHIGLFRRAAVNGAFYSPHRAEGFGLPLLEAMACGVRAGTSDIGGPSYTTKRNGVLLKGITLFPGTLTLSEFHNWSGEPYYDVDEKPQWLEPDAFVVKKWLKEITTQPWTEQDAEELSKKTLEVYSFSVVAKKLRDFLKKLK